MHELPSIRPPSEAYSLLIRATRGCPWNRCAFCDLYKRTRFMIRPVEEVCRDIQEAKRLTEEVKAAARDTNVPVEQVAWRCGVTWVAQDGSVRTAFLGDSNSIVRRTDQLVEIIRALYDAFPEMERVTSYGRAETLYRLRTHRELVTLREAGLRRIHVGLETGDPALLSLINKGATPEQMVEGGRKALDAGIELTEYVILGLGGRKYSEAHALGTARVLNEINPDHIRLRTLVIRRNTPIYQWVGEGTFTPLTPLEVLKETRLLLQNLNVKSYLLSDHVSNYLPLNGRLSDQKQELLDFLTLHIDLLEENPGLAPHILTNESIRRL